jgi:hypothetical protein
MGSTGGLLSTRSCTFHKIVCVNPDSKENLSKLDTFKGIILIGILKNWCVEVWALDPSDSEQGLMSGCYEQDNEPSGSIEVTELLH